MPIEQHTYTSCSPGQGYDGIDGFQTKARSAGLTDAMNSLIRHYGGRYRLPRSAQNIEYACRREGRTVLAEALLHFPVALTYYPIDGDVFALTRTCYIGQDHSGRFGTFFAHTLVFPVEALQPLDYNPLALARTHLFESADPSDRTTLPTLPDFQHLHVPPDQSWMRLAAQEPYAEQLAYLISATMDVPQTGRPVMLCLPRWDHAAHLIEAVLLLLPADVRCRTAFATYEHDPYRLQGLRSTPSQSGQFPLQMVVTLSRHEGGAFKFQYDEYHSRFAIFNFAEQRFSPQPPPSAYARYVAACCLHSRMDRVTPIHRLITALEAGREPEQWDRLLPAAPVAEPGEPQSGAEAVHQATALQQPRHRPTGPQRDTHVVPADGVRRPRHLTLMAALAAFSLLGAGIIWQSSLVRHKPKESAMRSGQNPAVVLPQSPTWREPPLLPHSPARREPPLLPQSPAWREPPASRR